MKLGKVISYAEVSFSYLKYFEYMENALPGSEFILTICDDANRWYKPLTKFHGKV